MQPDLIITPFGENATPGTIEAIPETLAPGDPVQRASWNAGFPQVTMTPLAAGGIPPRGQDFNGVLKAISEHTVFLGAGGQYKWSADLVAAAGGYAKGAVVQSNDGLFSCVSAIDGNAVDFNTNPESIGTQWLLWTGNGKASSNITFTAGIGLDGGGDLTADRTFSVKYGAVSGTSAQGNDPRIVNSAVSGIAGSFSNLKASATGTSATVTVTADSICLKNASNEQVVINALALAINSATVGVNGLDTGVLAASTWYYTWVIWNGVAAAGLLSLSATDPVLPAGYTHKARVGSIRTDSTANKFPLSFIQAGREVRYKIAAGSNMVSFPQMTSNVNGSLTTPTWVAVGVSSFVPPTAVEISVIAVAGNNGAGIAIVPNNSYGPVVSGGGNVANRPQVLAVADSGGITGHSAGSILLESGNIYVATTPTNNTRSNCFGYTESF